MSTIADLNALASAVTAVPRDATARMVYADALDESGKHIEAAFQRVLAEPAEGRHRLAYADAVEPSNPVRAEFVRVQCERDQVESIRHTCRPHPDGGPDEGETTCSACGAHWHAEELRQREYDLLKQLAERIAVPVLHSIWPGCSHEVCYDGQIKSAPGGIVIGSIWFDRGFVGQVICPAADWLAHGDKLRTEHPIELVRLRTLPDVVTHPSGMWFCDDPKAVLFDWQLITPKVERARFPDVSRGRIVNALRLRFPGITFEVPA